MKWPSTMLLMKLPKLLDSLVTNAKPRDREVEAQRAHARAVERFGA